MKRNFTSLDEVYAHGADTVIDVRSPAEYAADHWPGAINLPALDNAERARIGTIYKQQSPFEARILGAALVARNAARHLEGALRDKPGGWLPLVYCWRGGQRSGSFATILDQIGWRVAVVAGGYKTYRRLVVSALHEMPLSHPFVVLDGNTGTAKTELLGLIAARGVQVLDLEGLAAHRGSLFGAVAPDQPSQKAFESAIAIELHGLDPGRPVVVEAESSKIGDLLVPPSLWEAMKAAPRIAVSAPVAARAAYLVRAYGDVVADTGKLHQVLGALTAFHGREQVDLWRQQADAGQYEQLAAALMQEHYDPAYGRWRRSRPAPAVELVAGGLGAADLEQLADRLVQAVGQISFRPG